MSYTVLEDNNIFEIYISKNDPVKQYCFSPLVYESLDSIKEIIPNLPVKSLYTIGQTGHTYTVVLYKDIKLNVYKFLLNYTDIVAYYE